jgi:Helix-turn-helix domain
LLSGPLPGSPAALTSRARAPRQPFINSKELPTNRMSLPYTPTAAALYLGISEKTLSKLRRAGRAPDHTRDTQGHVQYTKEALDAWRLKHRRTVRYIPLEAAPVAA